MLLTFAENYKLEEHYEDHLVVKLILVSLLKTFLNERKFPFYALNASALLHFEFFYSLPLLFKNRKQNIIYAKKYYDFVFEIDEVMMILFR